MYNVVCIIYYVCECVHVCMYMYSGEGSVQYNIHYNTNCINTNDTLMSNT